MFEAIMAAMVASAASAAISAATAPDTHSNTATVGNVDVTDDETADLNIGGDDDKEKRRNASRGRINAMPSTGTTSGTTSATSTGTGLQI